MRDLLSASRASETQILLQTGKTSGKRPFLPAALLGVLLGLLGGGAVIANPGLLLSWAGQNSSTTLSVESSISILLDGRASEARQASAQAVVRTTASHALPMLRWIGRRDHPLADQANATLAHLTQVDVHTKPKLTCLQVNRADFQEASALLLADTGSLEARVKALQTIRGVLSDAFVSLDVVASRGGESGEMAVVNLAWFHSFLAGK